MSLTIKHRVSLDLSPTSLTSVQATIPFRKGDKGAHEVIFSLRYGTTNVELPPGTVATIAVLNGYEKKGVLDACVVDHVNNQINYIPTVNALKVAGNIACELVVTGPYGETLGAPRFHFLVDDSMTDVTEEEITEALKASGSWDVIQKTAMNAKDAEQSKVDAQKWANGTDVTSDDPQYQKNAKYYAQKAGSSADEAQKWANGEGTVDGNDQYQKNAKYYAEEAEKQKNVAAQFVVDARKWADGENAVLDEQQYKNNAKYYAQEAESSADEAQKWANGEGTVDGDDQYQKNAKHYSTLSMTYAGEARNYAEQVGNGAKKIEASINSSTYDLTLRLLSTVGNELSSTTIALPLQELITEIAYDNEEKDLIFTLRNGKTLEVELDAILTGLVTNSTLDDKLKGKVDKLDDKLRLYGTNSAGEQTSYSIADDIGDDTQSIMTRAAVKAVLNDLSNKLSARIETNKNNIAKNAEEIAANTERIDTLKQNGGGGGNVEIVQTDLANLNDRLTSFYLEDALTIHPNSQEVVNGAYGWSGFANTTVSCVTRPMRVLHGEKITVSGNGLLIHCFLLKESTFENNTILRGLTSTYTESFTFEVPLSGYLIVNIKKTNGAQISTSEASAITITRKIEKNNIINLGLGLMTTDASGNFIVSNAGVWKLSVFPVQVGKTYDLTLLTSNSSGSRVKWAFSSLPYYEVTKDTLNASNVILHAEPIFTDTLQGKLTCTSVTAPEGTKSLVLNSYVGSSISCGDTHIIRYDDGEEERVVPQSAVNLNKSDIVKNVVSAGGSVEGDEIILGGGKYYVLGTLVKTKAHSENIILRMTYRVERNDTASLLPHIFTLYDNHFGSTQFVLDNEEYMEGSWRFPAFGFVNDAMNIIVDLPEGNTLYIKDIKSEYSNVTYSHETGVRLTAHLGVYDFAPENTMYSFIAAHNLGYPSCVANPKITGDGVFVCIHDDDISRTATNADGTEVNKTVLVSQSRYADLLQYDFGRKYNEVYAGAKIPKLDDFLFYCGKAGMKPVFSTHSNFTDEQWREIKGMMTRYGILKSFTCKGGFIALLESAYSVFKDEIEFYVFDTPENPDIDTIISNLNSSSLASIKDKVIIEMPTGTLLQSNVEKVLAAGYKAGAYDVFYTKGERYKEFIKWGITEFVDDRNCSYGLNW